MYLYLYVYILKCHIRVGENINGENTLKRQIILTIKQTLNFQSKH